MTVSRTISSKIDAREKLRIRGEILKSLYFDYIQARYQSISEAHPHTFDWIFDKTKPDEGTFASFINWLEHPGGLEGLYWVAGKPGSGKSTLMRFLSDSPRTKAALETWSGSRTLLSANMFFWHSGSPIQKSLEGLLRSILLDILSQHPDIIPKVASARWRRCELGVSSSEWTNDELKETFKRLVNLTVESHRIFLLIDGLDEYHGTLEQRIHLIRFLKVHAASPNVKICASSREWSEFTNAFGQYPCLKLEELTRPDIQCFVEDRLAKNMEFNLFEDRDEKECKELVNRIVDKAEGVFLWVFLVVQTLMQKLIDGDTMMQVLDELSRIPRDLIDFFKQILEGISPADRARAGLYLKVKLASELPLSLMSLSFLEEIEDDVDFLERASPQNIESLRNREQLTARRVQSRCKGLLEVHRGKTGKPDVRRYIDCSWPHVDYLHRTVRDFLKQQHSQETLFADSPNSFDCHEYLCRAVLAWIKMTGTGDWTVMDNSCPPETSLMENKFFGYILEMENISSSASSCEVVNLAFEIIPEYLCQAPIRLETRIATALYHSLEDYPMQMLSKEHDIINVRAWCKRSRSSLPLLAWAVFGGPPDCAEPPPNVFLPTFRFRPYHIKLRSFPSINVVRILLEGGANPNEYIFKDTLWCRFLKAVRSTTPKGRWDVSTEATMCNLAKIARLFIEHGAAASSRSAPREPTDPLWVADATASDLTNDHVSMVSEIFEGYGGDEMAKLLRKNNSKRARFKRSIGWK